MTIRPFNQAYVGRAQRQNAEYRVVFYATNVIIADINSIARTFGGRTIFSKLSWSIQDGEKIGLIGPSGCGKSTVMRILAGEDDADGGAVTFRRGAKVAYLPQEFAGTEGQSALGELLAGHAELQSLEAQIVDAERRMGDPEVLDSPTQFDALLLEHERFLKQFDEAGGAMLRNRAEGFLRALGLEEETWDRPMELLSGGQRKIVGIARCLLAQPDLLLLDEPDNHLDLARKAMLERVIRDFEGAVIVISHDRYLLDETIDVIVEFEPNRETGVRLTRWEGNYSAYQAQREVALLRQQERYSSQQQEIAHLEAAVARFRMWARMVLSERHRKQAGVKQRQIDTMEKVERPVLERRRMSLHFRSAVRGGAKAMELRHVEKAFGDTIVLLDANATVMNGERVGIVGPNGSGKSVLMKIILGQMEADTGEVWIGPSIKTGHYAQEHETLDFNQTPIEAIRNTRAMYEGDAVAALQRFLLPYEACQQPIAKLSGGEKSRVQLARLMQLGANCLLLDEPTNNLDISASEVLEEALDAFKGTVVVISHDRYFLDRLVDRVFEIKDGDLRVFEGGYSYYAEQAVVRFPKK